MIIYIILYIYQNYMTIHPRENLTLFASQSPHSPGHLHLEVTTHLLNAEPPWKRTKMAISHLQIPSWGMSVLKFGDVLSPCPSSNSLIRPCGLVLGLSLLLNLMWKCNQECVGTFQDGTKLSSVLTIVKLP